MAQTLGLKSLFSRWWYLQPQISRGNSTYSHSSLSLFLDNLINCLSSFRGALEETIPWLSFWSSSPFCLFTLPGGLIQSGSSTSGYNVEGCEKDFPPLITAKGNKDKLKLQVCKIKLQKTVDSNSRGTWNHHRWAKGHRILFLETSADPRAMNLSTMKGTRIVVSFLAEKKHTGTFRGNRCVLYCDMGDGYTGVYICPTSLHTELYFEICVLHFTVEKKGKTWEGWIPETKIAGWCWWLVKLGTECLNTVFYTCVFKTFHDEKH